VLLLRAGVSLARGAFAEVTGAIGVRTIEEETAEEIRSAETIRGKRPGDASEQTG